MVHKVFVLFAFILALPDNLHSITTTHHDKTEKTKMSLEALDKNISSTDSSERHRRLIPYMTFYLSNNNFPNHNPIPQNQYQHQHNQHKIPQTIYQDKFIISNYQPNNNKFNEPAPTQFILRPKPSFTPFLDTNKLPGGFTPIVRGAIQLPQNLYQSNQEPNFSAIFDKLLQIKQLQKQTPQFTFQDGKLNIASQYFRPQPTKFIPVSEYQLQEEEPQYKPVETGYKQLEHEYKPIEATYKLLEQGSGHKHLEASYKPLEQSYKPIEATYKPLEQSYKPVQTSYKPLEQGYKPSEQTYKPIEPSYKVPSHVKTIIHTYTPASIEIPVQQKLPNYDNYDTLKVYNQIAPQPKPTEGYKQILIQDIPSNPEKNYNTYILRPMPKPEINFQKYRPLYRPVYAPLPKPKPTQPTYIPTPPENPNSLSVILKQLQDSNTLPHTLTPDNIDNSIKTLVNILNSLKNTKLQKPIIVDDISDEDNVPPAPHPIPHPEEIPPESQNEAIDDFNQLNTPEGGTPGKAGEDYPAYSIIPQTGFDCKTQRYKGFFGDPETNCQVWHYCDLNGGQASFLCPNGTIFSQVALTCDWWYNVKCATTTQLYVLNERLYKYILPFTPKFPEDYSGPLVDKYLALKFKEMEEKMRKQKTKGKTPKPEDDTREGDVDKLQIIEAETITKPLQTPPTENIQQDEEISNSEEK